MSKRGLNDAEESANARGSKKRKVRSCMTCRKQKARCEFTSSTNICHRCTVLNIPCIFEGDAPPNPLSTSPHPSPPRTSARNETAGQLGKTNRAPGRQSSRGSTIEDRLSTIEEAVRQVLRATGLPSLETFSVPVSGPPSATSSFEPSSSGSSGPVYNTSGITPFHLATNLQRRAGTLYSTPVDLGYITLAQSTELTSIFEMRYNHCVYTPILKSQRITLERPFTFTVMCALALRLKTTIPNQPNVREKIHRLLDSHLRTSMGARPYCIDAIHGLLLISLWGSVLLPNNAGPEHFSVPDGWLLLSMAIHMAQSLQLNRSVDEVENFIQQGREGTADYELALEKAKVWYTLVTYDLAMSVGPARPRIIVDCDLSQVSGLLASLACSPTDQCLAHHLDALLLVHRVYTIARPAGPTQIPEFTFAVDAILRDLELLSQAAENSSLTYGENQALCLEYRMFRLYEQYCECVCLSKACETLISSSVNHPVFSSDDETFVLGEEGMEDPQTATLALLWMGRICSMAASVIDEAFPPQSNDSTFLSTAPDHMFTIVAFCAVALIQSQATVLRHRPDELDRAKEYDEAVERAIRFLSQSVLPDSRLPRHYAHVLSKMLEALKIQRHKQASRGFEKVQGREQSGTGLPNGAVQDRPSNGGDLLALAATFMQRENRPDPTEYVVPSMQNVSTYLDPSTWLQDASLDWDHSFGTEQTQHLS